MYLEILDSHNWPISGNPLPLAPFSLQSHQLPYQDLLRFLWSTVQLMASLWKVHLLVVVSTYSLTCFCCTHVVKASSLTLVQFFYQVPCHLAQVALFHWAFPLLSLDMWLKITPLMVLMTLQILTILLYKYFNLRTIGHLCPKCCWWVTTCSLNFSKQEIFESRSIFL